MILKFTSSVESPDSDTVFRPLCRLSVIRNII